MTPLAWAFALMAVSCFASFLAGVALGFGSDCDCKSEPGASTPGSFLSPDNPNN